MTSSSLMRQKKTVRFHSSMSTSSTNPAKSCVWRCIERKHARTSTSTGTHLLQPTTKSALRKVWLAQHTDLLRKQRSWSRVIIPVKNVLHDQPISFRNHQQKEYGQDESKDGNEYNHSRRWDTCQRRWKKYPHMIVPYAGKRGEKVIPKIDKKMPETVRPKITEWSSLRYSRQG